MGLGVGGNFIKFYREFLEVTPQRADHAADIWSYSDSNKLKTIKFSSAYSKLSKGKQKFNIHSQTSSTPTQFMSTLLMNTKE